MTEPNAPQDSLQKCIELLRTDNDTAKLVALSLLPRILQQHQDLWLECWSQLDFAFIDRLLHTGEPEYELVALAVLSSFVGLDDDGVVRAEGMLGRLPALLRVTEAYSATNSEAAQQALGLLKHIVSHKEGALRAQQLNILRDMVSLCAEWLRESSQTSIPASELPSSAPPPLSELFSTVTAALQQLCSQGRIKAETDRDILAFVAPLARGLAQPDRALRVASLAALASCLVARPGIELPLAQRDTVIRAVKQVYFETKRKPICVLSS